MQNALKVEIKRLSERAFSKQHRFEKLEEKYRDQFEKRTGLSAGVPNRIQVQKPKHFDPLYCARNANFLAKTIWHKVLEKQYEPVPAINYLIPKPDGSKRSIMAFSIPDAALANILLRRVRQRNLKRFSPSSYAYHPNKNVFDAVLALSEFKHDGKLFAVQIDFEKYFDLIPSYYLKNKINDQKSISVTPHEKYVFDRFLHHKYAQYDDYKNNLFTRRIKGTPQGSSISLILANLANHDLDILLSSESGKFVRFADDVVALCSDYEQSQRLERCFQKHCKISGIKINYKKSPGIAIISDRDEEIRTYACFDYLGYRFSSTGLSVPDKVIDRIKSRISRLTNLYLIEYLEAGFNTNRSATHPKSYDWDLLGLMYELRRSLYGGLSEHELYEFIYKGKRLKKMKGLMGFYCLLDKPEQLKELDGWMLSVIRRAMVKRNQILKNKYSHSCPTPTNAQLATGQWLNTTAWRGNSYPEVKAPSFVRGWRAARKHYYTFGLESVQAPQYLIYNDIASLFGSGFVGY